MAPLQFPPDALPTLERAYTGPSNLTELDKWLIYTTIATSPEETQTQQQEVWHAATSHYNSICLNADESEWPDLGFCTPANQAHPSLLSQNEPPNLQDLLTHHLSLLSRRLSPAPAFAEDDESFYAFGFIAVTHPAWRTQGLTLVHCDFDRGKWKVTACADVPVEQLGLECTSVSDSDEEFDLVRARYAEGETSRPDNLGGAVPKGKWQFLVLCSGTTQTAAERAIPDPRGDPSFPLGEGVLWFLPQTFERGDVVGGFVVAYAAMVRDLRIPANPAVEAPCRRHPGLFVHVDTDDPGGQGVELVRVEWDGEVEREDEELRAIARGSRVTTRRCSVDAVVSTLSSMAGPSTPSE